MSTDTGSWRTRAIAAVVRRREPGWIKLPPCSPGMKIGLLGGSFNPPHDGHRHISLEALARLNLDRVWWLISPGNPLKDHDDLAALRTRISDANRLTQHPHIEVTGFESLLGTSYTAETLSYLKTRAPGARFVWLMGADNLAGFHRWRDWRRIPALMPVAVFDRPGWRYRALASPAAGLLGSSRRSETESRCLATNDPPAWTFLSIPLSSLSSSAIRARARQTSRSASAT